MEVKIQIPDNCELVKEGDVYKIKEFSYPKTWEEYCKMYPNVKNEYYINFNSQPTITSGESRQFICDKNLLSSKEEAEAFLAFIQLRRLREAWVKDFTFNWEGFNYHVINRNIQGKLRISLVTSPTALCFPSRQMAEDFFSCFKDLLETAKILL